MGRMTGKSFCLILILMSTALGQQVEMPPQINVGVRFSPMLQFEPIGSSILKSERIPIFNEGCALVAAPQKEKRYISDKWFGSDKADHLTVSAVVVGFGYYAAREEFHMDDLAARNSAMGFSLTFGVAKEVYDWKSGKGTPSYKDLIADIVGIGVGFLMITLGD